MDFMKLIVIWGLTAISAGVLAAILAGIKNRDYSFWIAWCFLLPPLVLFLIMLPKYQGERPRRPPLDEHDHQGLL